MIRDNLFKKIATTSIFRGKRRAAGNPLASYVLRKLPKDLQQYSADTLAHRQQTLLSGERQRIAAIRSIDEARLTQLDLLMLLNGYLLNRDLALIQAPPLLLTLIKENAKRHDIAPRMTYEYIIDVNTKAFIQSRGNIRVFSSGTIARTERDFYIGHYYAEKHIKQAYRTLRSLLDNPNSLTAARLRLVLRGLENFLGYMAAFARLPHQEYGYFRRFIAPYPDNVRNASGAFMPTPQLFEMLLHPPGYTQTTYITTNLRYFPRRAMQKLQAQQDLARSGRTLEAMLGSGVLKPAADEAGLLGDIVEKFIQFKLMHIRVVSSKIPEAFPKSPVLEREALRQLHPLKSPVRDGRGAQRGTGGFAPQDFLGDGINRLLALQKRLFTN